MDKHTPTTTKNNSYSDGFTFYGRHYPSINEFAKEALVVIILVVIGIAAVKSVLF